MIVVVRKINAYSKQNRHKKIEFRNFKYFNANNFQTDLITNELGRILRSITVQFRCPPSGTN